MRFREWLGESIRVTDRWPLNKDTYDMETPEGRKRYDDELRAILADMGSGSKKVVSEKVVREPYTITCWRGFNAHSHERDVFQKDGRLFISSAKAMEGILWFSHSLQSPSIFSAGSPEEHALSYAKKYDEGYLLTYPLNCVRTYKSVRYEDGRTSEDQTDGLGPEWTKMDGRAYLLPRGWFVTWQTQMFLAFRGVLEIEESMLRRVS